MASVPYVINSRCGILSFILNTYFQLYLLCSNYFTVTELPVKYEHVDLAKLSIQLTDKQKNCRSGSRYRSCWYLQLQNANKRKKDHNQ